MVSKIKKLKQTTILCIILFSSVILISLFNLINLFSADFWYIINMILVILFFFVLGIRSGKKAAKRGFLSGLKIGFITSMVFFLLYIIFFGFNIHLKTILYYTILIISSILGSMVGINKKEDD